MTEESLRDEIERAAKAARKRTSDRHLPKLTGGDTEATRIADDPPVVTHPDEEEYEALAQGLDDYLETLTPQWRRIVGGYTLMDIAHKVVGVGSVGMRAWVALLVGSRPDDVLFLQLKQAQRSVLAPFVHGAEAHHAHQGQRGRGVPAAVADRLRSAVGLDHRGRAPVLRAPPVPQHEGRRPA